MNPILAHGKMPIVACLLCVCWGCANVQITQVHKGVVVDADTGKPLSAVTVQVQVMRVSSFDGLSKFQTFTHITGEDGTFDLPMKKKVVDSVTERVEDIRYYEVIRFVKDGYHEREYRSDDDESPFRWRGAEQRNVVVKMWKKDSGKEFLPGGSPDIF